MKNLINKKHNNDEIYKILCTKYSEVEVSFVMYDICSYINKEFQEKEERKYQQNFKDGLITRYKRCIISDTPIELCEACHIIPFSKCEEKDKYNINNGILLRCDLHKLFDDGLLKINPDSCSVVLSKEILLNDNYKDYHKYHNKKINIYENSLQYLFDLIH